MTRAHVGPAWAFALAGIVALALHPVALPAQQRSRVRTVEIAPADAQIQVGQQQVFLANGYDAGNNPVASAVFTFRSSDTHIATVDANGIAVGVSPGRATITARTGTGALAKYAQAVLVVVAATPAAGQRPAEHPAEAAPVAAAPPTPVRPVAGRPTGPGYAAFDFQPAGSGPAVGLVIRPLRVVLVRGESRQLEYTAVTAEGQNADRVPILFSVVPGGESIVSVDSVGFLRAAGNVGEATVRAVVPNNARVQPKQIAVDVRADTVRFAGGGRWLTVGSVDTLRVEVLAQNRPLNVWGGDFQFSSSDEGKVRVYSALQPVIVAAAPGTAQIVAESPYFNIATTVHVLRPTASFAATPADSALTLAMSVSVPVTVQALAADSSPIPEAPLRWTLPDSTVARFDTATRTLRAVHAGETRLAVSAPVARDSSLERVWLIRVVAGGLAVSRSRVGVGEGEQTPVGVQLLDDQRHPIGPAPDLRWTSSADSVASFVNGEVRGRRPGHAVLTARAPWDSTATVDVYVVGRMLAAVQRAGRWGLYTFGPDSVPRLQPLAQSTAVGLEPAWSPDLTRIAYVAAPTDRPASMDLFVADADGGAPRRLTNDSATVGAPTFVPPAGDRIVFQSNRGGTLQLYVIGRDGSRRTALGQTGVPNSQPDVSPDGSKVLFVSLRQQPNVPRNYDIWEIGIDGTGERRMTTSPRAEDSPLFAPDGRSFYYLRDDGGNPPSKRVYRQSLDDLTGAGAQPVTPPGLFVRAFSVSPDGRQLVLTTLERVRGMGEVPHVQLFDPATNALTPVQLGSGEQMSAPVFRPATPQPR